MQYLEIVFYSLVIVASTISIIALLLESKNKKEVKEDGRKNQ